MSADILGKPNAERVWVCDECGSSMPDEGARIEAANNPDMWGHPCMAHPQSKKPWRCEAHWTPYVPEVKP
jgi:hypothetical protein